MNESPTFYPLTQNARKDTKHKSTLLFFITNDNMCRNNDMIVRDQATQNRAPATDGRQSNDADVSSCFAKQAT